MKEQRNCNYELRSESRTVEGYALVFDKESRDLGVATLNRLLRFRNILRIMASK